jgi:hypothetical protein
VLVAAAVCPHPPLLVPEGMGAAGQRDGGMSELLAACDAAVAGLIAAEPDLIAVVGGAAASAVYDGSAAGSLREYGVGFAVGTGQPVLPLALTVGSWLLRRAGLLGTGDAPAAEQHARATAPAQPAPPVRPPGGLWLRAVAQATPVAECLRLGAGIARQAPRVAMLAMGDGSARRAVGIEGAADPAADRYDAEVAAALAGADPARLAGLDPALDDELMVAGRAAWQVLAGAADGERLRGRLRCAVAPYEVSYLVASWDGRG